MRTPRFAVLCSVPSTAPDQEMAPVPCPHSPDPKSPSSLISTQPFHLLMPSPRLNLVNFWAVSTGRQGHLNHDYCYGQRAKNYRQNHASITRIPKRGNTTILSVLELATLRLSSLGLLALWAGQAAGVRKTEIRKRGAVFAHHGSPGNAPPPELTENQDILAGRQLGSGAGGHLTQDRGPVGKMTKRPVPDRPSLRRSSPARPAPRPATLSPAPPPSPAASRSHHRLWPSSSSLVRSLAAATAGPLGPSSTFFSTPTGAILPTAATKRALPRVRQGPVRTLAGQPAARRPLGRATRRTPCGVRGASRALPGSQCPQDLTES